jgi:hypothetical protein
MPAWHGPEWLASSWVLRVSSGPVLTVLELCSAYILLSTKEAIIVVVFEPSQSHALQKH